MEPDRIPIAFTVNRRSVDLRVEPHHTLLAVLRSARALDPSGAF